MINPAEEDPELYAAARDQIMNLIRDGKAIELMSAYSEHMQSCAYIWTILRHVESDESDMICNGVKNFARNLMDDWSK